MFCAVYDGFVGFGVTVDECMDDLCSVVEDKGFDAEFDPEDCQFFECVPVGIRRAQWEFVTHGD